MLEVANASRARVDAGFLKKVAAIVLAGEKQKGAALSIALVTRQKSQELNLRYRKRRAPANVLSFAGNAFALGEVVLCPAVIRAQERKYGIKGKQALAFMLIHGILHLTGERHGARMERKERRYLVMVNF